MTSNRSNNNLIKKDTTAVLLSMLSRLGKNYVAAEVWQCTSPYRIYSSNAMDLNLVAGFDNIDAMNAWLESILLDAGVSGHI